MTKETEREEQKLQAVTAQSEQQSNDYEKKVSRGVAGSKKVGGGGQTPRKLKTLFSCIVYQWVKIKCTTHTIHGSVICLCRGSANNKKLLAKSGGA